MLITYNNLSLANETHAKVTECRLNGNRQVQETPLFRAIATGLYARKNKAVRLEFTIAHTFESATEAETHALTHEGTLPDQGDVVLTTGLSHETRIVCTLTDAVIHEARSEAHGCIVRTLYRFSGTTLISTGTVEPIDGGNYVDGGEYGSPLAGSIDGGGYADALVPTSLDIVGEQYL